MRKKIFGDFQQIMPLKPVFPKYVNAIAPRSTGCPYIFCLRVIIRPLKKLKFNDYYNFNRSPQKVANYNKQAESPLEASSGTLNVGFC